MAMEVKTNSPRAWLLAARPKTLTGAAVPVMIGLALAWTDTAQLCGTDCFRWVPAVLCLLFALVMQIDANLVNDYVDYVRGTDDRETRLGPERACAQGWVTTAAMRRAIGGVTLVASLLGLPLVWYGGVEMVLIGMLCVVCCFLYTTHFSYMGLGDVLVLLFFGLVPVATTYWLQLHRVTAEVLVASVACGLVIDGLLLVNNFRDRDTDRVAGKRTLVVRLGARPSLALYAGVGVAACAMGLVFAANGHEWAALLPLAYLALHLLTAWQMGHIWQGRELNRCLGATARNILVYGLTVTAGMLVAAF